MPHSTTSTKICSKCSEEKPLSQFRRRKDASDGLSRECKACAAERGRAYRAANHESVAETKRAWYVANREHVLEMRRAYRTENRERIAEWKRAWYEANRDRKAETNRAWREANRERAAEKDRAYYEANRERIIERSRAWARANPEKRAEIFARTFAKYPDRFAARRLVNNAVRRGDFPPARDLPCTMCGEPAQEYHHYLGYEPEHALDVIALCIPCHKKADAEADAEA